MNAGADCEEYDAALNAQEALWERVGNGTYEYAVQEHLVDAYSSLHFEKLLPRSIIQNDIKGGVVDPLVQIMKEEIYRRLANTPAERQALDKQIGTVFDVHRDIQSAAREEGVLRRKLSPVKPQQRELVDRPDAHGRPSGCRRGDFVYDVLIKGELEAMAAADPSVIEQFEKAAAAWAKERPSPGDRREVYVDFSDGQAMHSHPELGVHADRSDGSLRLAIVLYYDDVEVVNPLGAFHGRHKLGLFYWALVNVDVSKRMAFQNLHLKTVALVSDIDYYGIEQVVSGLPGDTSFGSDMTSMDAGVQVALPNGSTRLTRGWCMCLSADHPAAALCLGFKKTVSASLFCRCCYVNQREEPYPTPNSFLDANANLSCEHCLRNREMLAEHFEHFNSLPSAKEKEAYLTDIGMNTLSGHAFTRVPHFDICRYVPFDFMHVELEGSLKNELAAMLYYFIRQRRSWDFTLAKLNQAILDYPWPGGFRPPTFTAGYLEKGTKAGKCKTGCHVHMTAGDMMLFTRHSIDLLLPLVKDPTDELWMCWVAHVRYVRLLIKETISYDEIVLLDQLIYDHHKRFLEADEYGERLFKPKNHFACHFPVDILNFGPVRGYWCMRFEALNQMFKNFAKTGAFRNTCFRCADFWTVRMAMERDKRETTHWGATRVVRSSLPATYQRSKRQRSDSGDGTSSVLKLLFKALSHDSVSVEWIHELYHGGCEYRAGLSWVSATYDGSELLAHVPACGIFRCRRAIYMLFSLYPCCVDAELDLPTTTVPATYVPASQLIRVDSKKLSRIEPVSPSFRVVRGQTVFTRFVPLK